MLVWSEAWSAEGEKGEDQQLTSAYTDKCKRACNPVKRLDLDFGNASAQISPFVKAIAIVLVDQKLPRAPDLRERAFFPSPG
jgi:hypothetical protein